MMTTKIQHLRSFALLLRKNLAQNSQLLNRTTTNRRCRHFSTDAPGGGKKHDAEKVVVRPYSGSLPSPGYEWCRRCHIPCKRLQKPVANKVTMADPCYSRIGDICEPARRYYRRQYAYMAFWIVLVFGVLPPGVTFDGAGAGGRSFNDDDE